tara:strand:+ start:67 stop:342 length:276 start_codon:yes stop_codon:yes gene_type:complete
MINKVEKIANDALRIILQKNNLTKIKITNNLNIHKNLDSLAIVNLILETEQLLENSFDKYEPLSDNLTFDLKKSPLLKFSSWVKYIEKKYK